MAESDLNTTESTNPFHREKIEQALNAGNSPAALQLARQAIASAKETNDPEMVAAAHLQMARVQGFLGNNAESIKALEAAVASLPGADSDPAHATMRCRCLGSLGQTYIRLRRNDVARHAISRGLVAAGAIPGKDSDIHQALLAAPMAWLEIHSGECAKAAERLVVAISHFPHNAESWPIEAQLLALLAHSRSRAGQDRVLEPADVPAGMPQQLLAEVMAKHARHLLSPDDGKGAIEELATIHRLIHWVAGWLERVAGNQTRLTPDCLGMLAEVEGMKGDFGAMANALARAQAVYHERGETLLALQAARVRVGALAKVGNLKESLEESARVLDGAREQGNDKFITEVLLEQGQLRFRHGENSQAEASFREALEIATANGFDELVAMASMALGGIVARAGRTSEAGDLFRKVAQQFPAGHPLHQAAVQNLGELSQQAAAPAPPQMPEVGELGDMLKDILPGDMAKRLESLMEMAKQQRNRPGGAIDPEADRALREIEARTLQRLQGILGKGKGM